MNLPCTPPSPPPAKAMLLAAGHGKRMRPLTEHTPKPLLAVHGKPLLQWPMQALAAQGFCHIVINTGWLGARIPAHFGTTFAHGGGLPASHITYSREDVDFPAPLETAGGIARALPHLADVFWLAAGDVYAPAFAFDHAAYTQFAHSTMLAHLWLVPNPPHHPDGDFAISPQGLALDRPTTVPTYTYSTIALMRKALFAPPWCTIAAGNPQGTIAPLAPLLRAAMQQGRISASVYQGDWTDVGTPQRLAALNAHPPT